MKDDKNMIFPDGFLWGTATSAHQVEGDNFLNDWWEAEQAGDLPFKSGKACDHYHRFEEDFDLAQKMANNACRLSIEWSRVEPTQGKWDENEIEHYRAVLAALRQRRLKVMLTLHHFTNPLWLARMGGWENPQTPEMFARFVRYVAENLGDLVDFWVTINEPNVYASQAYFEGLRPPFQQSLWKTKKVMGQFVRGHQLAYEVLHQVLKNPQVGAAQQMSCFTPERKGFFDRQFVKIITYYWNDWFLEKIQKNLDFIGLNYYFRIRIARPTINPQRIFSDSRQAGAEVSDLGWEVYPDGLREVLLGLSRRYRLPIYITENGIAANDDKQRVSFLLGHLAAIHQAIEQGADVRGYFHWSLLDNFEWALGYAPLFGLIGVDPETLKRQPKPSSKVYGQIAKENKLIWTDG